MISPQGCKFWTGGLAYDIISHYCDMLCNYIHVILLKQNKIKELKEKEFKGKIKSIL